MKKYITRFLIPGICSDETATKGSEGFVYLQIEGQKNVRVKRSFFNNLFFMPLNILCFFGEKKYSPRHLKLIPFYTIVEHEIPLINR